MKTLYVKFPRRETSVWFLLLAFASHKWVIGACLGLNWARYATAHAHTPLFGNVHLFFLNLTTTPLVLYKYTLYHLREVLFLALFMLSVTTQVNMLTSYSTSYV
jgi:hypothetical protein